MIPYLIANWKTVREMGATGAITIIALAMVYHIAWQVPRRLDQLNDTIAKVSEADREAVRDIDHRHREEDRRTWNAIRDNSESTKRSAEAIDALLRTNMQEHKARADEHKAMMKILEKLLKSNGVKPDDDHQPELLQVKPRKID